MNKKKNLKEKGKIMLRFEMEAPIVMESKEEIVQALRDIADQIEEGQERDFVPGEVQCAEWSVDEEDEYIEEGLVDISDEDWNGDEYGFN